MVIKTKKILIKKVTDILHDIGMPAHIKGFYYVRDAIILVYQDITRLNHIINDVYALVAKRHHTSIQSVERRFVLPLKSHGCAVIWMRLCASFIIRLTAVKHVQQTRSS